MGMNLRNEMANGFAANAAIAVDDRLNSEGIAVTERISEIMMMCERVNPIYEQINGFSIALYAAGVLKAPDLMMVQDIDSQEAGTILRDQFTEVRFEDIPDDYTVSASSERYLLVVGNPDFPAHFALLVDIRSKRPYFSKLPFFGSGFDSLAELAGEFPAPAGAGREEIHYFRENRYGEIAPSSRGKIYIFK